MVWSNKSKSQHGMEVIIERVNMVWSNKSNQSKSQYMGFKNVLWTLKQRQT